jgi:hypothetical protein
VPLAEQELPTLPGHLNSPPVFSGVRVTRSLVLCVCFVDGCLSFFFWPLYCLSFFDLRNMITSLWYLQTLLPTYNKYRIKRISLKLGFELDPVTVQLKYIKSMLITYHGQYENEIWPPQRVLNDIHPRRGWSTYNQEETISCLILWLYFYEWRHDIAEILLSWR